MQPNVLTIVRQHVGRRRFISRQDARSIFVSLAEEAGLDLRNNHMADTWELREGRAVEEQTPTQIARAATVWANAIEDITVVSVLARGCTPHGEVRYDQPGSMAPLQHAALSFISAELRDESVGYLRRHADRLLIVRDEEPPLR